MNVINLVGKIFNCKLTGEFESVQTGAIYTANITN